ncbi:MAG: DUF5681 domain-containing protein [Planctomycetota bacterium]|jgi:hypothetical protein
MPKPENIEPYQYVKGQSGNPAGSKKGTVKLRYRLAQVLKNKVSVRHGNENIKLTAADIIIDKLLVKAAKGDIDAIRLIFQYTEGMPVQALKHSGDGLEAPRFNIVINREKPKVLEIPDLSTADDGNKSTD